MSDKQRDAVFRDIRDLVMSHSANESMFNWQAVTDMVVQRYADLLMYLASGVFSSADQLRDEICRTLEPYGGSDANTTAKIERCAGQFLPTSAHLRQGLAGRAIRSVMGTICSTLEEALEESSSYTFIVENIEKLINYLSWSVWKECRGCSYSEFCAVLLWPWGMADDYENPKCRSVSDINGFGEPRYWGGRGRFGPMYK